MGFLNRLLGLEKREASPPVALSDPYLAEYLGLRGGGGAPLASPSAAVSSLAVAARCVSLISDLLASVPLMVYRRMDDGGRKEQPNHPIARLFSDAVNDSMSGFEFRALMVADLAQEGNAFARIEWDGRGGVGALHYLPYRMVGIERLLNGRLRYRYTDPVLGTIVLLAEEAAHLRYRSRDGIIGISPMVWAQGAVGLAMAQSELAETQARRGFVPDTAFAMDAAMPITDIGDAAFKRLKDQLTSRVRRLGEGGDPLLLEAGLKPMPLATNGREAQFHEARVLGLEDIARIYGVPLSVVGLGNHSSYGSLTEESRSLVQNCLAPWASYVEKQLSLSLLSADGRRTFEIEHDLSGLLRGDMLARLQAYQIGIQSEIWSPNEVRRWEGQSSRPGGDEFRNPNTRPAGPAAADSDAVNIPT